MARQTKDRPVPEGYMVNALGHLVPEDLVPEIDKVRDGLVREIAAGTQELQAQMAAFKRRIMADADAFVALAGEKYGVALGGAKGNVSLVSYDGSLRVLVAVTERITLGPEIQAAKALIDRCIHEWTEGSRSEIRALVEHAFQTDKEGKLAMGRILGLLQLDIDDETWVAAMAAIRDSITAVGTARYIRVYERVGQTDRWQQITLDFAAL